MARTVILMGALIRKKKFHDAVNYKYLMAAKSIVIVHLQTLLSFINSRISLSERSLPLSDVGVLRIPSVNALISLHLILTSP